jgi:hypothetical protein
MELGLGTTALVPPAPLEAKFSDRSIKCRVLSYLQLVKRNPVDNAPKYNAKINVAI